MDVHHLLILKILRNNELTEVYAMMSLRAMAMSLISIFVPIYLYTLGYDIPTILLFFIIISTTHAIFCPISAKISSKMGFKHGMLISFIGYFLYFVMLATLPNNRVLFPIAVFYGIAQALFWVPFHAFFSTLTDNKNRGEEVALLYIFPSIFSIAAPLIGGLIIFFAGFDVLFVVGLVLLMAAALPLFVSKDMRMPFSFSLRCDGFDKRVAASLISYNDQMNSTLWPMFIFVIVGSIAALGGIVALGAIVGFATAWIIGKLCDKGHRKKMLQFGAAGQFVLWILRAFASSLNHIISLESVWGVISKFKDVSYNSAYYEKARKARRKLEFSTLREMSIHISTATIFCLIYVFYSHIGTPIIFFIAAVGAMFNILIER
ncbi:MAG: MFS transporter [Candidatus Aenigmatarchaeota archaeon]